MRGHLKSIAVFATAIIILISPVLVATAGSAVVKDDRLGLYSVTISHPDDVLVAPGSTLPVDVVIEFFDTSVLTFENYGEYMVNFSEDFKVIKSGKKRRRSASDDARRLKGLEQGANRRVYVSVDEITFDSIESRPKAPLINVTPESITAYDTMLPADGRATGDNGGDNGVAKLKEMGDRYVKRLEYRCGEPGAGTFKVDVYLSFDYTLDGDDENIYTHYDRARLMSKARCEEPFHSTVKTDSKVAGDTTTLGGSEVDYLKGMGARIGDNYDPNTPEEAIDAGGNGNGAGKKKGAKHGKKAAAPGVLSIEVSKGGHERPGAPAGDGAPQGQAEEAIPGL